MKIQNTNLLKTLLKVEFAAIEIWFLEEWIWCFTIRFILGFDKFRRVRLAKLRKLHFHFSIYITSNRIGKDNRNNNKV